MEDISPDQLNQILREELAHYQQYVLHKLSEAIRRSNMVLSGETLKSLQAQVLNPSADNVAGLLLAFQASGRIREMRRLDMRRLAPLDEIEAFVRKVGVSKFGRVPGYRPGVFPVSQAKAVNRIAWGIRTARRRNGAPKPKRWYAKTFYSSLNYLIDNIVTRYQQTTGQVVGGSITDSI